MRRPCDVAFPPWSHPFLAPSLAAPLRRVAISPGSDSYAVCDGANAVLMVDSLAMQQRWSYVGLSLASPRLPSRGPIGAFHDCAPVLRGASQLESFQSGLIVEPRTGCVLLEGACREDVEEPREIVAPPPCFVPPRRPAPSYATALGAQDLSPRVPTCNSCPFSRGATWAHCTCRAGR